MRVKSLNAPGQAGNALNPPQPRLRLAAEEGIDDEAILRALESFQDWPPLRFR